MKLFKYNQFINTTPLNENLDKSKKFLKEQEIMKMAANELGLIDDELQAKLDHREKIGLNLSDFDSSKLPELKKKMSEIRLDDAQTKAVDARLAKLSVNAKDAEVKVGLEVLKKGESAAAKLRTLFEAENTLGWLYNFVYMFYAEKPVTMSESDWYSEIIKLYRNAQSFGQLLDKLPKKFDLNFIDPNISNNTEKLIDGLDSLESYKKIKKMIDTLPSKLKAEYNRAPELVKKQMDEIATGFSEVAEEKREAVWKTFFGELKLDTRTHLQDGRPNPNYNKMVYSSSLRRFETMDQPLKEFIKAAQNHLAASKNDDIIAFYDKINQCNELYGVRGADIVFDETGILVIEVRSFQANKYLNGHTRHCIKDSMSQWDSYVASKNNKQYYIYNFNIPQLGSGSNLSVIGVTIGPYVRGCPDQYSNSQKTGEIFHHSYSRACHAKDDTNFSNNLKSTLKGWEKEYDIKTNIFDTILKPMSPEEIARRERAIVANREIVKKGISIEQIKQYVTQDGADINKDNAKALTNAVEENDLEKTKLCLELGASPNLQKSFDAPISKAKNLEMIKLLVSYGSEITGDVFDAIQNDPDAVEYCLKAGLDPNFGSQMGLRKLTKGSWKNRDDIGSSNIETFKLLLKYGASLRSSDNKNMILRWSSEYARLNLIDYLIEGGFSKAFPESDWLDAAVWASHARKTSDAKKTEVYNYLKEKGGFTDEQFKSKLQQFRR